MGALVWPQFLSQPAMGSGLQLLRSAAWSQLSSDWIAANNPIPLRLVGRSPNPATAEPASDIFPGNAGAGIVRSLPSAGFTIAVASSSANDVATTGSGAWTICVPYLDVNYVWHFATYALNGTTKVSATLTIDGVANVGPVANALRILPGSFVLTSASSNTAINAGAIYIGNNVDAFTLGVPAAANLYDAIIASDNRSSLGAFTVPAGMALVVLHAYSMNTAAGVSAFYGKSYLSAAVWPGTLSGLTWTPAAGINPWQRYPIGAPASTAGLLEWNPNWPDVFFPKSEMRFQGISSAANGEITVIAECALAPWPWAGTP